MFYLPSYNRAYLQMGLLLVHKYPQMRDQALANVLLSFKHVL
jgi:hypothetical protein